MIIESNIFKESYDSIEQEGIAIQALNCQAEELEKRCAVKAHNNEIDEFCTSLSGTLKEMTVKESDFIVKRILEAVADLVNIDTSKLSDTAQMQVLQAKQHDIYKDRQFFCEEF